MACSDRVIEQAAACEEANPLPIWAFNDREYPATDGVRRFAGGWLVGVDRYAQDVLESARTVGVTGEAASPTERRTLWVDPCGHSYVVADDATSWHAIRPGGPWLVGALTKWWIVREERHPLRLEPLPGIVKAYPFMGEVLAAEREGRLWRWDPDTPWDQRELLMNDFSLAPAWMDPEGRWIFMQAHDYSVWMIDGEMGKPEKVAEGPVRHFLVHRGGDALTLVDDRGHGTQRIRLLERSIGRETLIAEGSFGVLADGSWRDWFVVGEHVSPGLSGTTILVFLTNTEIVRLPGRYSPATTEFDPEVLLVDNERTYRFDRATRSLEPVLPFAAKVVARRPEGTYLVRSENFDDDRYAEYALVRVDDLRWGETPELVIERADSQPLALRDGTWAFLRNSHDSEPGDLFVVDAMTRETRRIAQSVPWLFGRWNASAPEERVELLYPSIEAGVGGTLWAYRFLVD